MESGRKHYCPGLESRASAPGRMPVGRYAVGRDTERVWQRQARDEFATAGAAAESAVVAGHVGNAEAAAAAVD